MKKTIGALFLLISLNLGATVKFGDLSFLFPLSKEHFSINFSDKVRDSRELFSKKDYDSLNGVKGTRLENNYEDWKIVGFRFIPCFPSIPKSLKLADCEKTLIRLVAQPVDHRNFNNSPTAVDSAIHLVFEIPNELRQSIVSDLIRIKKSNPVIESINKLGLHPGLSSLENTGNSSDIKESLKLAKMIKETIFKYINGRLKEVTLMTSKRSSGRPTGTWTFTKHLYENEKIVNAPIEGLSKVSFSQSHTTDVAETPDPFTIIKGIKDEGLKKDLENSKNTHEETLAGFRFANKISNPLVTEIPKADCVSCHFSTNIKTTEKLRASDLFRMNGELSENEKSYINAFSFKNSKNVEKQREMDFVWPYMFSYNMICFGYSAQEESMNVELICDRVVNEEEIYVKLLNQ